MLDRLGKDHPILDLTSFEAKFGGPTGVQLDKATEKAVEAL